MVRNFFFSIPFQFFDSIIQKEIYQYGIDFGIRALPKDFTPNLLNAPNATT